MILELCKGLHCVDLSESFQTHTYSQKLVLIQPRTSPVNFARSLSQSLSPAPILERPRAEWDLVEVRAEAEARGQRRPGEGHRAALRRRLRDRSRPKDTNEY